MTESFFDTKQWRFRLAELSGRLHLPAAQTDPLLWATACSIDSAELLLRAYEHQNNGSDQQKACDALLEAVSSARAAVGAATYAAQERHGSAPRSA